MNTMSDPYRETEGYGAQVYYRPDSGAHIVAPPLDDEELTSDAIDALPRPTPLQAVRMRDRIEAVRTYVAENGGTHSVMGWVEGPAAEAADVRGVENFFADLLLEPERIGDLMDVCNQVALPFAKEQIDLGADTIGIGDAVASQVSQDVYERLILPREQWLVREIKAYKPEAHTRVRLHICGNITHLLPGISTLGIDIVDVDHMVDMEYARSVLGTATALAGNIDPVAGVLRGTPELIRQKMRETYEKVGNPFMANAGCEIPSGTPKENLLALCEPIAWQA